MKKVYNVLHMNLYIECVFIVKTKQILQPREEKLGGAKGTLPPQFCKVGGRRRRRLCPLVMSSEYTI